MHLQTETSIQQKDLFNDPLFDQDRWPRRPYCSEDPTRYGVRIRSLKQALTCPYIQANPPHLRVWAIFDCDYSGAILAWEDRNLPPPTWAAKNRENSHAHLVWGLSAPVLVSPEARDAPVRYLAAIEAAFAATLEADPGYSGLLTKNPAHPQWHVLRGPRLGYELSELADWVDWVDLERFKPKRGRNIEVGVGRNVTLFDRLRHWAYRHVLEYKKGGLDGWNAWLSACNSRARELNDFVAPLDGREVWWIAKSVAKWTWRRFSEEKRREIQAQRGRRSGEVRRARSEEKRASARLMRAQGMPYRHIAEALGVSVRTAHVWCQED